MNYAQVNIYRYRTLVLLATFYLYQLKVIQRCVIYTEPTGTHSSVFAVHSVIFDFLNTRLQGTYKNRSFRAQLEVVLAYSCPLIPLVLWGGHRIFAQC